MNRLIRCRQHVSEALKLVDREQDAMLTYLLEVALLELDDRLTGNVRVGVRRPDKDGPDGGKGKSPPRSSDI